jgi:protein tyrosine phosphatase (PTP) superfamily phosphohydrolase (DUF442 family)
MICAKLRFLLESGATMVRAIVLSFGMLLAQIVSAKESACLTPLDSSIQKSCIVVPNVLWRGPKPSAADAKILLQRGVRTVVNLELLHDDKKAFQALSGADLPTASISYFRARDWEPLVLVSRKSVDRHVARFIAIMRTQTGPVYVHCRSGENRTGVMVAAYRMFAGMPMEQAIAEMQGYEGFWAKADARYLRSLTPERRAALEPKIVAWMQELKPNAVIRCGNGHCDL